MSFTFKIVISLLSRDSVVGETCFQTLVPNKGGGEKQMYCVLKDAAEICFSRDTFLLLIFSALLLYLLHRDLGPSAGGHRWHLISHSGNVPGNVFEISLRLINQNQMYFRTGSLLLLCLCIFYKEVYNVCLPSGFKFTSLASKVLTLKRSPVI